MIVLFTNKVFCYSVFENSILFSVIGLLAIVAFVVLTFFDYLKVENRALDIACLFIMFCGYILLLEDPVLSQTRMWIAVSLIGFGYAPASALIVSIFSRVIPQTAQGLKMGAFSSAGSLARIIGPIIASNLSTYYSYNALWLLTAGTAFATCLLHIITYDVLAPLPSNPELQNLMDKTSDLDALNKSQKGIN